MNGQSGKFFAIGAREFANACDLGMNPAVSLLVMARGTINDNATTSWSALSIFNHTGIARRRAQKAIEALIDSGLVRLTKKGTRPRYKLQKPKDEKSLLWLPNELIDGAGKEVPPIMKLRESSNLELLQKFIELYGVQDLDNDGGLPRTVAWSHFSRNKICDTGHFTLYAFNRKATTAKSDGLFADYQGREDDKGNQGPWTILNPLAEMGLLRHYLYMAESEDPEAELIYPVNEETEIAIAGLQNWLEESGGIGFSERSYEVEHLGVAVSYAKKATMVGLYRLHYRPKTGKTSRWWAMERSRTEAMVGLVDQIVQPEEEQSVHIKAVQSF